MIDKYPSYGDVDITGDLAVPAEAVTLPPQPAEASYGSDRDLYEYSKFLNFDPENYRNKKVLDVGCGLDRTFARQAERYSIDVVSLSPTLRNTSWLANVAGKTEEEIRVYLDGLNSDIAAGKLVEAVAQAMPFASDSFDAITSMFAVPFHIPAETQQAAFAEMIRVLKPGGEMYVYPVSVGSASSESVSETTINFLRTHASALAIEEVAQLKQDLSYSRLLLKK